MRNAKVRNRIFLLFSAFFLLFIFNQSVYSQITISLKNATLKQVIDAVKARTDYQFFYEDKLIDLPVGNVEATNLSLAQLLSRTLKNTGITYKIEDKVVYLSREGKKDSSKDALSETREITGMVVDSEGEPLIGVSILVKGTMSGAVTGIDGNYTLSVPGERPELVFSYVGYLTQTVRVEESGRLDVTLSENVKAIDEVVVTALGIKKEKKALGYAIQEVASNELNRTGDPSVSTALQGKVAGVIISQSATGLGGSTKISIRGNSSMTGSNEPLWVIDGIPFNDKQEGSGSSLWNGYDRGGSSIDLNPEDIESISILKGPNAAALYGSRSSNGVIMVTTKKGVKNAGFGVAYSGAFTFTQVAETLDMQSEYGQGYGGNYAKGSEFSWGPKLDGSEKEAWNQAVYPYSRYGNKLKDYFQTGFSQSHNVAFGNTSESTNYRLSIGHADNKGIFDGEKLKKINVDLRAGTSMNPYFSLDSKVSISHTQAQNRPQQGKSSELYQLYRLPNNLRLDDLKDYMKPSGAQINWITGNPDIQNPYYIRHRFPNKDARMRAFGYLSAKVNVLDWMHFSAKQSMDYSRTKIENMDRSDGIGVVDETSITDDNYSLSEINFYEMNTELLLVGDKPLNDWLHLGFTVGGNLMHAKWEELRGMVRNRQDKSWWALDNVSQIDMNGQIYRGQKDATQDDWEKKVHSVFGNLQLAYNHFITLDLSCRNDWSSSLPKGNRSYPYASASLSYVHTDMLRMYGMSIPSWLSFAKMRLSVAQVGNDTQAGTGKIYTKQILQSDNSYLDVIVPKVYSLGDKLKPEISTSYEAGIDMKFLDNRLGFDFTVYRATSKNQIMNVPSRGLDPLLMLTFPEMQVNSGTIENKGLEWMCYTTPVKTKDVQFDLDLNLATNRTKVKKITDEQDFFNYNSEEFIVKVMNFEGGKMGDIVAEKIVMRDENGELMIYSNGLLPDINASTKKRVIGNIQPDLTGSLRPSFRYQNIRLNTLFDFKVGGDVVSITEAIAAASGTAERTAKRDEPIVVKGVDALTGQPAEYAYSAEEYYRDVIGGQRGYAEMFLYDASFIRFKELSVSYSFPKKMLNKTFISGATISAVARNLCYLFKNTPGTNPEASFDNSIFSQAIDFVSAPYSRTFGCTVQLSF